MVGVSCKGGTRLAVHNSNLEDGFRLGRNYTLAVTETVRRSDSSISLRKRISGGRLECQQDLESAVPGASVRLESDPGAARTNESQ